MRRRARRVVVVLGFSNGDREGLHPVCAARLTHAAAVATGEDVVVLSGWARVAGRRPEAELMRAAWRGDAAVVVVDPDARSTVENAANALDDIRQAQAGEVVIVTSRWHAARARAAFRWLLRGSAVRITTTCPPGGSPAAALLRELVLWPLLPLQLAAAGRRG